MTQGRAGIVFRLPPRQDPTMGRQRNLAAAVALAGALHASVAPGPTSRAAAPDRVWIAGRYDDTHVVMYFATAHFRDSSPPSAVKIPAPKADGFFDPEALSLGDVERGRDSASTERFAIGDRYDLVLDRGHVATVVLTSLVAFESDEQVGNDSYVGAIARVSASDLAFFTRDYYVVRPFGQAQVHSPLVGIARDRMNERMRGQVITRLRDRLAADSDTSVERKARTMSPIVQDATPFTLADGGKRWYVRGTMSVDATDCTKFEAWLAPRARGQEFRLLAVSPSSCSYDMPKEAPRLLNAVDLGAGRIGLIMEYLGEDGRALVLHEYVDGSSLAHMPVLQTIAAGE